MKEMRSVLNEILGDDLSPGEVLRASRIKSGISQDELEEITDIARSNISALENGRIQMTIHYAIRFAAALKLHPSDILFPNGHVEKSDEIRQIEKRAAALRKRRSVG